MCKQMTICAAGLIINASRVQEHSTGGASNTEKNQPRIKLPEL